MKTNLTTFILSFALLLVSCSTSKTGTGISSKNTDSSPLITARNLSNHITSLPRLQVRGSGSNVQVYNAAVSTIQGDTRPLFVLDGIQVGRDFSRVLSMLDEHQQLSVDFLKISRATIRYGESGRNGVVMIGFKN
jgi:hypothetical protein